MMTRSVEAYHKKIVPEWMHEDALRSPHAVPQLLKITLNMGVKEAATDRKVIPKILDDLTLIAGQRPVITRARKSIAGFKIRAGMVVGFRVTLRRARMYAFFDRLIHIVLPRVRDFRGLSHRSFDGRGNYAFGLREQIVFPEIDYDKIDRLRGLDVGRDY